MSEPEDEVGTLAAEGNRLMLSGAAIGVATVASTVLLGATCPLCVVGVPALIGWGAAQRIRAELLKRKTGAEQAGPDWNGPDGNSPDKSTDGG